MEPIEEIEQRLEAAETNLQTMLCVFIANMVMFEGALTAMREDGVLNERMIKRMLLESRARLLDYDTPQLSDQDANQVASHLEELAQRLQSAAPSAPLVKPVAMDNGFGRGHGDARRLPANKRPKAAACTMACDPRQNRS